MNCWEVKRCGRETGGPVAQTMGICPAAANDRLHGVHGGRNGGRACWVIAGTKCGGQVQGSFASKYKNCERCDFYKKTKEEEKGDFILSIVLLNKMKGLTAGDADRNS
ncbi:MAG: two-CW domain-containing protein [Deltaproteobacteria bacterium]